MSKENLNFEDSIKKLEEIANELETGNLNLDESVEKFEEGIKLSKECTKILSDIRLGINMGIIKEVSIDKLNEIATKTQPGSLQMSLNTELNESERDEKRAEIIKEVLKRGE